MSDNLNKGLAKKIDTALHPERNGVLIQRGIAEGASHEHIIKESLLELINNEKIAELKRLKQIDAFNEAYSSDTRPSRLVDIRIKELLATLKKGSE